jgi:hypothetical protein
MACLDDEKLADCIIAVRGDSKPDKIIALAAGWAYILNKKPSDIRIIKSYVRFVIKQKPILDSDYFMLMSLLDTTTFYLPEKIVRALISSSDLSYEEMDIVLADKGIKLERASLLYSGDVRWLGR